MAMPVPADTNIVELARRAAKMGMDVVMRDPAPEIPDTQRLLAVPMDPQLEALYRVTNGCTIGNFYVYDAVGTWDELVPTNLDIRQTYDYIPLLQEVIICARYSRQSIELVPLPAYADEHGLQPVVILDANDVPIIFPLASTLNRAFELVVIDEIGLTVDYDDWSEGFPFSVAHMAAADVRLMELVHAGAFDHLGGGVDIEPEFRALLCELAPP